MMNRDNDMSHTVHPLDTDAEHAYRSGHLIAASSLSDMAAFGRAHPEAVTGTVWAGPGMTLWYTAQEPNAAEKENKRLVNW